MDSSSVAARPDFFSLIEIEIKCRTNQWPVTNTPILVCDSIHKYFPRFIERRFDIVLKRRWIYDSEERYECFRCISGVKWINCFIFVVILLKYLEWNTYADYLIDIWRKHDNVRIECSSKNLKMLSWWRTFQAIRGCSLKDENHFNCTRNSYIAMWFEVLFPCVIRLIHMFLVRCGHIRS